MTIPFEYVIWDAEDCADYFKISKDKFMRHTRHLQGFPKPVTEDNEQPRWRAVSVAGWAVKDEVYYA